MRAIGIKKEDTSPSGLFVESDVIEPQLEPGEALVEVKAFGLNRMDIMQRQGAYPPPPKASAILGVEYAGVIKVLHPEGNEQTAKFKVGDSVFGLVPGGAYAELVAANTLNMMHLPEGLSFEQAAGIPETWFTASQALTAVSHLQRGESLLFHAGASGVGIGAIQIAQAIGARKVYATVGSDDKVEFIKSQLRLEGTDKDTLVPINYHKQKFEEVVKQTDILGVDVIVDPVGQSYFHRDLEAIAVDGRLVILGLMSGPVVDKVNLGVILSKRASVIGTTLRTRPPEYQAQIRDYVENTVVKNILDGRFKHYTHKVFTVAEIGDAHRELEANVSMGKIIVKW